MKKDVTKENLDAYFQEAQSWELDKDEARKKSEKRAWIVASVSGAIAFMAVCAVVALTPLKTVVPYIIRVDNSTGIVDVVNALKDGETNYEEAMNKYWAQWYVRFREGYSKELATDYYNNVALMSDNQEQQRYYAYFTPKNPSSPLNLYGEYAKARIHIKGTSFINPTTALVRYSKDIERGNDKPQTTHWAATIVFKYIGLPMSEKDREVNPLGFQVTEYRNDPEALSQEPVSPPVTKTVPELTAPRTQLFPMPRVPQPPTQQ